MTDTASGNGVTGGPLNRCYGLVLSLAFLGAVGSQVYIPFPEVQLYFMECAFFCALLLGDAMARRASFTTTLCYALATLVVAPLAIPHWYANRPLYHGEVRKGGVDTNFLNAFAIVAIMFTGVAAASNFLSFGADRGFELIINSGFCVAGTALVAGLTCRKESVLETGVKRISKNAESELGE